jgi:ATP-dependent helicase HrpA
VARPAGAVLLEWAAAQRKLKDARPPKEVADDVAAQLQRLVPKRFVAQPTGRRCSTCRAT